MIVGVVCGLVSMFSDHFGQESGHSNKIFHNFDHFDLNFHHFDPHFPAPLVYKHKSFESTSMEYMDKPPDAYPKHYWY